MPSTSQFSADETAVSPVIGTVLFLGIVVAIATLFGALALDVSGDLVEPAPAGYFEAEYVASGEGNTDRRPYVEITNKLGETADADNIIIKDESGNTIAWSEVWTGGETVKAGEYVHLDGFESDGRLDPICEAGDTYTIVYTDGNGHTLLVNEWSAPTDPQVPAGSDAAADDTPPGVPKWC